MAITEKKLASWAEKRDLKKLHKALTEHNFKIRLGAIAHLAEIKDDSSLEHLEKLVNDPFVSVLKAASEAVGAIRQNHPAISVFEEKIEQKENMETRAKERTKEKFEKPSEEERRAKAKEMAQKHNIDAKAIGGQKNNKKDVATVGIVITIILIVIKLIRYFNT